MAEESHTHLSISPPAQSPFGPSPAPHLSPLPPNRLLPAVWCPPVLPAEMCLCHLTAPPGCHGGHRGPGGGAGAPTTLTRLVPWGSSLAPWGRWGTVMGRRQGAERGGCELILNCGNSGWHNSSCWHPPGGHWRWVPSPGYFQITNTFLNSTPFDFEIFFVSSPYHLWAWDCQKIASLAFPSANRLCAASSNRTGFLCDDRVTCVPASQVCDRTSNCRDGEDEQEELCGEHFHGDLPTRVFLLCSEDLSHQLGLNLTTSLAACPCFSRHSCAPRAQHRLCLCPCRRPAPQPPAVPGFPLR